MKECELALFEVVDAGTKMLFCGFPGAVALHPKSVLTFSRLFPGFTCSAVGMIGHESVWAENCKLHHSD